MRRNLVVALAGAGCLLACCPGIALAAGGGLPSLVRDIGFSILLAGVLAILFTRLRIPEIAAFLLAGVLLGPVGTGLVTDPANIETIAKLGLILLLYLIGLEIDLRKLLGSGRVLLVSGLLQYPLCVLLGIALTRLLLWFGVGSALLSGDYTPLYIGFVLAASSTLLVAKLLQESFQMDTEAGRVALGLLIFQDVWAIVVIALQPNFTTPDPLPILMSFLGIALLTLVAGLVARHIIPVGFRWAARRPEVIFAASISWCFLVVLLGVSLDDLSGLLFGVDLQLAVGAEMGALIAGATIASLPYSMEIIGKVSIVRDFFVTLFFVGLGMSIPVPDGSEVLLLAALLALATILARFLVFFPMLYFTGLDRRNALISATRLAQVSEFSLVIGFLGVEMGHIPNGLNSTIIFAFVATALLTPTLFHRADGVHTRLSGLLARLGFREPERPAAVAGEDYSLVLLGFHRVASSLLHELRKHRPELLARTLVVDFNVKLHDRIATHGASVRYGDLANAETLAHAGVGEARVIVSTVPDDVLKGTSNLHLVRMARRLNPAAVIIANAIELADARMLYEAGADFVFLQRVETAQAVERAIEKALAGDIEGHRSAVEAQHGAWHARDEVM
jgi:Kef-type K+ transport system membrane component KefB